MGKKEQSDLGKVWQEESMAYLRVRKFDDFDKGLLEGLWITVVTVAWCISVALVFHFDKWWTLIPLSVTSFLLLCMVWHDLCNGFVSAMKQLRDLIW